MSNRRMMIINRPLLQRHCNYQVGSIMGEPDWLTGAPGWGPGPEPGPAAPGCLAAMGAAGSGKGGSCPIRRLKWSLSAGCTGHRSPLRCFSRRESRLSMGEAGVRASRRLCATFLTASEVPCCRQQNSCEMCSSSTGSNTAVVGKASL